MGSGLITPTHLIFLLLLALLLFGAKRLPEIGRGLGTGMKEFKDSVTNKDDAPAEIPPPAPATPAAPPAAPEAPVAAEPKRETETVS